MLFRSYIATEALTFCSKYIETADQLSKEVGEDNLGLNVFDYFVRVIGNVDKRTNLKI